MNHTRSAATDTAARIGTANTAGDLTRSPKTSDNAVAGSTVATFLAVCRCRWDAFMLREVNRLGVTVRVTTNALTSDP